MKTLLYQCPSGICGDMNLGAMVALGVDPTALEKELRKLSFTGWSLHFETDHRQGIAGIRCDVILEQQENDAALTTSGEHHHQHHHHHPHRGFAEIQEAIEQSDLSAQVKRDAVACFRVLAEAEAAVHGIDPEKVQFHEVGAIDSIIDMVGAAICWDLLQVDRLVCSTLEVGGGTVRCAHGQMPVPAPATVRLLQGIPYQTGGTQYETTTPTGAALLVGKKCEFLASTSGRQITSGIGIGQRNPPGLPNVLYVSLIEESTSASASTESLDSDEVVELAANLDDMTGEAIGFLCEQLREAGALDVWQTAAHFKHDRPGCVVHALVEQEKYLLFEYLFFLHSRTLGVRRQSWKRAKMKREIQEMDTEWGPVRVKIATGPDSLFRHKIEYRDCARIAADTGRSLASVEAELERLFASKFN